jgi:mannosyltransferase OCH1-like enzyme
MTFTQMISKSYGFDNNIYRSSAEWKKAKELFVCNQPDNIQRIPKKIHQIWVGSKIPDVYKKYTDTWIKFHPEWEYKLWTDHNIDDLEITSKDVFKRASNPAMKSDILRYEILRQHGGLYIDTDFECIKPFDDLLYLNFFTGISYDTEFIVYNGLIGSVPNHPILNDAVRIKDIYNGNVGSMILHSTGAYHFTKCFSNNLTSKVVAFPMEYFYPYPNHIRGHGNPKSFLTKDSYALHYWEVSWSNKKKNGINL